MKESFAMWLTVGVTAVTFTALIFNSLVPEIGDLSQQVNDFVDSFSG